MVELSIKIKSIFEKRRIKVGKNYDFQLFLQRRFSLQSLITKTFILSDYEIIIFSVKFLCEKLNNKALFWLPVIIGINEF